MKVLLAGSGTRGDVQPALALALVLIEKGHQVLLAAPAEHGEWIESYGCSYTPIGGNWREMITRYPDGQDMKAQIGFTRFLRKEVKRQFEELPPIMEGFDLAVSFSLMLALHSVAEYHNVPSYWVATTPQLLPSVDHPPLMFKKQNLPAWINRLAWRQSSMVTDLLLKGIINGCRKNLGLSPIDNIITYNCGAVALVATDPELGLVPDDVTIKNTQLGNFYLKQKGDLGPEIEDFLKAGSPPVYVGFGSMAGRAEKMTRIIVSAVRSAGERLILASGWANLGGVDPAHDLLVIGNAPHPPLFPRMKAVVHHGGSGTTATAARAGVPQIIIPHLLDQFYWAKQIQRTGLGPKGIPHSKLSSKALAKTLKNCLATPEYQEKAAKMAVRLRQIDGARNAATFLEKVMKDPVFP